MDTNRECSFQSNYLRTGIVHRQKMGITSTNDPGRQKKRSALLFLVYLINYQVITYLSDCYSHSESASPWGVAVVKWLRSRPLHCEVRGSNPGQGRNLNTKISASSAPQQW